MYSFFFFFSGGSKSNSSHSSMEHLEKTSIIPTIIILSPNNCRDTDVQTDPPNKIISSCNKREPEALEKEKASKMPKLSDSGQRYEKENVDPRKFMPPVWIFYWIIIYIVCSVNDVAFVLCRDWIFVEVLLRWPCHLLDQKRMRPLQAECCVLLKGYLDEDRCLLMCHNKVCIYYIYIHTCIFIMIVVIFS